MGAVLAAPSKAKYGWVSTLIRLCQSHHTITGMGHSERTESDAVRARHEVGPLGQPSETIVNDPVRAVALADTRDTTYRIVCLEIAIHWSSVRRRT